MHTRIYFILLFTSYLSYNCYCQVERKIYFDANWKAVSEFSTYKYYRIVNVDNQGNPVGEVKTYYRNSASLEWTGKFKSKNLECTDCLECGCEGLCTWYFQNGQKSEEAFYENGKVVGAFKLWDEQGNIKNETEKTRQERLINYVKNKSLLKTYEKQMASQGIDVYKPDYSQENGGSAYQVFIKLRSNIKSEAIALGLSQSIADGWYKATVDYDHSNTITRSTYVLDVKVVDNVVVIIDFEDGKSVHSGPNNSNYYYDTSELDFEHNYNGDIVKATSDVYVTKGKAKVKYSVTIQ